MGGRCLLDEDRLRAWVEYQVSPHPVPKDSDPFFDAHWDEIDPGWQMPWYRKKRSLPRRTPPGDEFKVPGYCFDDAVDVFLLVREFLPSDWPGVLEVVVPLGDSRSLMTEAPKLDEIVPDWHEPPLVYLLPESFLARYAVGFPYEGYLWGYTDLPSRLRDDRTNVVFRSVAGYASYDDEDDAQNHLYISCCFV
jgi:hypothetical protein